MSRSLKILHNKKPRLVASNAKQLYKIIKYKLGDNFGSYIPGQEFDTDDINKYIPIVDGTTWRELARFEHPKGDYPWQYSVLVSTIPEDPKTLRIVWSSYDEIDWRKYAADSLSYLVREYSYIEK